MNRPEHQASSITTVRDRRIARIALFWFLLTFVTSRTLVFLIMARKIPDLFVHVGGTHVHHLNFGIFLLAGVGAYLLFRRPARARVPAALLGVGLALTFDEFGMWLNLGGSYWQRASWDAVAVTGHCSRWRRLARPCRTCDRAAGGARDSSSWPW